MDKSLMPELGYNVCFGGRAKYQLFKEVTTNAYMNTLNRQGVQFP